MQNQDMDNHLLPTFKLLLMPEGKPKARLMALSNILRAHMRPYCRTPEAGL